MLIEVAQCLLFILRKLAVALSRTTYDFGKEINQPMEMVLKIKAGAPSKVVAGWDMLFSKIL